MTSYTSTLLRMDPERKGFIDKYTSSQKLH